MLFNLSIEGIQLTVEKYVKIQEEGVVFITDSIVKKEKFNDFLEMYKNYNVKDKYFNTVIDGNEFHGRFGQIIYSLNGEDYKIRLVFVESVYDNEDDTPSLFVLDKVEYQNMKNKIASQTLTIDKLIRLLHDKDLLNEEEMDTLLKHQDEDLKNEKFKIATEVKDLDEYLENTKDRLSDIVESR